VDTTLKTSRLRVFGVGLVCAKVALVPLVFHPAFDVPFVVPKALLSHALAFLLAGVLVGLLILFGRSFILWSRLHLAVLAYLAVSGVATVVAADPVLALYGTHNRMLGLGTITDWVVTYFAAVHLVRDRTEVRALVVSTFAASLLVVSYELLQVTRLDPLDWSLDSAARPFSTLGQATALAQYLTTLAVFGLAFGAIASDLGRWSRLAIVLCSVALLGGMTLTSTRSPVLGLAAATGVFALLVWFVHPDRRARLFAAVGSAAATAAILAVILLTPIGTRLLGTLEASSAPIGDDGASVALEPSAAARLTLYGIAWNMLRERPILGYGPDNFVVGVPRYRPAPAPSQVRANVATSAHSWLAQTGATTGIVGLIAFASIVLGGLAAVARNSFSPLAVASAAAMAAYLGTGLTTVSEVGTDWLFWMSLAVIVAVTARPLARGAEATPEKRRTKRSRREVARADQSTRRRVVLAGMALAALLAILGVNALGASLGIRDAEDRRLQGRTAEAIELALRSTNGDPRRAEYWHGLGLAYVAAGRIADASTALERASTLAPYDVRYVGDLARAQLLLAGGGDVRARANAMRLGDVATRTDPNNPRAHLTRALVMNSVGDVPQALASVGRALELDPGSSDTQLYVTAVQVLSASRRSGEAIETARRGLTVLGQSQSSVAVRVELARALVAAGQAIAALSEIDLAVAIQPRNTAALRLQSEIRQTITTAPDAQITASPNSATPGDQITVTWSGIPYPTSTDWIGLFPRMNPDASYVAWRFTTGAAAGTVTLSVPASASPGSYNLRLFLNSQNNSVATSPSISVN
jgi:O-antigen ligase/tetratricopeptide (TPR) repeat protein